MTAGLCFFDKRFEYGALLSKTKGDTTRFSVMLATGRKVKVNQNRVLFRFQLDAPEGDHAAIRKALDEFVQRAEHEAEQIELDLLWDIVAGRTTTLQSLAGQWYGDDPRSMHLAAMLKLVQVHPMRFSISGDRITAVDDATLQKRIEAKKAKEKARQLVEEALPLFNSLADADAEAVHKLQNLESAGRFLDALNAKVCGDEVSLEIDRMFIKRFWVGENAREKAIAVLMAAGRQIDFVKVTMAHYGIQTGFSPQALSQAVELTGKPIIEAGRRDLRNLLTFSIDSETTRDYDDAISMETSGNKLIVWVHIADAGDLIPRGSDLDQAAREQIATLYLPDRIRPMLPEDLCFNRLSLSAGQDRAALSFRMEFNPAGEVTDFEPVPSLVNVDRNLDFDATALELADTGSKLGQVLNALEELRKKLWTDRQKHGASVFPDKEVKIYVDSDSRVVIDLRDRDAPGSRLIEELMILTNHRAARLCAEWKLPSIFRVQEQLNNRRAGPSVLTLEPGPHEGLAVSPYIQITSPIRRYTDLIMQRQISHWIEHKSPAYEERTELLALAKQAETELQSIRDVENEIKRYFTLVYFTQNPEQNYTVRVMRSLRDRPDTYLLEVEQVLFRYVETLEQGLEQGTTWQARVASVQPETGSVIFSRV